MNTDQNKAYKFSDHPTGSRRGRRPSGSPDQAHHAKEIPKNNRSEDSVPDTPLMRFGLQIRLKRCQAGLDPLEFAAKINLDLETLAAIEFGYAKPEEVNSSLNLLADGLHISPLAFRKFLSYLYEEH